MSEWQLIETAPKDDLCAILLFSPNCRMCGECTQIGWWSADEGEGGGVWHNTRGAIGYFSQHTKSRQGDPTHWMPLPKPPQSATEARA